MDAKKIMDIVAGRNGPHFYVTNSGRKFELSFAAQGIFAREVDGSRYEVAVHPEELIERLETEIPTVSLEKARQLCNQQRQGTYKQGEE